MKSGPPLRGTCDCVNSKRTLRPGSPCTQWRRVVQMPACRRAARWSPWPARGGRPRSGRHGHCHPPSSGHRCGQPPSGHHQRGQPSSRSSRSDDGGSSLRPSSVMPCNTATRCLTPTAEQQHWQPSPSLPRLPHQQLGAGELRWCDRCRPRPAGGLGPAKPPRQYALPTKVRRT